MNTPEQRRRIAAALLLYLCVATNGFAEELRWRAPNLNKTPTSNSVLVMQDGISPPAGVPSNVLPPRVSNSQLSAPPLIAPTEQPATMPSVLPPEVISGSAPQDTGWDPLGAFFENADDPIPAVADWEAQTTPIISHVLPSKPGLFQRFGLFGSWLDGGTENRAPSITNLSTFATFAVPFPIREWPLNITPGFDMKTLDGPIRPDVPPRLFDTYIDFTWKLRFTQRSTQVFSVAPGYFSDFEHSSGHAFRVTGKWVGSYDIVRNRITLLTGTIYLGRDDLKLLPLVGLVFTPNDWSRLEAVFPNPRASLRLRCGEGFEDWLYTGADFYGGQTWAIQRADASEDRLTILDSRAMLGYERRRGGGAGWSVESGWVFDRQVRYHNNHADDFRPDPTYYVRAGFTL